LRRALSLCFFRFCSRDIARKKEWIEWAHAEIADLSPEVEILNQQVPVLERFVEWLQTQESHNYK